MTRKHRRRRARNATGGDSPNLTIHAKHSEESPVGASEAISEPSKPGPGQVFVEELIDAQSGHAKRYRNVGSSPLSLAFYRGQLQGANDSANGITAEDRHSAGQQFARLWESRHATATYSFDSNLGGTGDPHWWCDRMASASQAITRLRTRMYGKNYLIVQRFCGEGYSMPQSLRGVVEVHPNAVHVRVREALDDLVTAMTGRRQ